MKSVILRQKPVTLKAFQWNNNEPEIREFIGADQEGNIRFNNEGPKVWNKENQSWVNVPMFSYILIGIKGELDVVSPEALEKLYDVVEE